MGFKTKKPTFNNVIRNLKGKKSKNYKCLPQQKKRKDSKQIFQDVNLLKHSTVQKDFEAFKKKAFKSWNYASTEAERKIVLDEIRDNINDCCPERKNKCKKCKTNIKEIDRLKSI